MSASIDIDAQSMIFDTFGRDQVFQEIDEEDPTEELFKSIVENDEVRKYD